jgi:hypothetical protein
MKNKKLTVKEWLAIRKRAAKKIDPATAEVEWFHEYTVDPYGVLEKLSIEEQQVGREYFARSPGSNVWVWFGDLPRKVKRELWKKHKSKLAFPAPPVLLKRWPLTGRTAAEVARQSKS